MLPADLTTDTPSAYLPLYEAVFSSYERMLQAAEQLDWERFFQLEGHSETAVDALPDTAALLSTVSEQEQVMISELLQATLECIELIKSIVSSARQEMSDRIDNTTVQRKLENTYTSF